LALADIDESNKPIKLFIQKVCKKLYLSARFFSFAFRKNKNELHQVFSFGKIIRNFTRETLRLGGELRRKRKGCGWDLTHLFKNLKIH
jgi:hypothetical protein